MKKHLALILIGIAILIIIIITNNAEGQAGAYHNYSEMYEELEKIENENPNIAKIYNISKEYDVNLTWEKRTLWAIKISDNVEIDEDEPEVLYMGAHHAREWISVEVPLYFLNYLIDNYGTDPRATWLVNNREIWILPMVNPDGVTYSQDVNKWWRKNRRDNGDGTFGVDLNRNYPFRWGKVGPGISNSHSPSSLLYCGPYDTIDDDNDGKLNEDPIDLIDNDGDGKIDEDRDGGFSEPETQAIKALIENRNFIITLSYHSYGEWWLLPWGDTIELSKDHDIFISIGENCSKMNGYWAIQGYELYPTSGTSDDWIYGVHDILAMTPEIATLDDYFIPPEEKILPMCLENLGPNLYIAEVAGNPRQNSPEIMYSPHNDTIESMNPYEIKVQIKSDIGIEEVSLYYKNDKDDPFISTPMIKNSEYEYSADIPSQDIGTEIFYYIYVIDQNGNISTSPRYTPYASHNFTVIEKDTENPEIVYDTRTDIDFNNETKEYTITALISDNVGLNSKKLYYHYDESSNFISKDFNYIMDNQYKVIINGSYRDLLYYYIEVNDSSGNSYREPKYSVYIFEMCFFDDFEIENPDWQTGGNNDLWHRTEFDSHRSNFSWFNSYENSHIYDESMNNFLFSSAIELPTKFTSILSFWHRYEMEYFFDGGIIEINNGSGWEQIFPIGGYNEDALYRGNPLGPVPAFTKNSALPFTGSKTGWVRALFDITDYGGEEIQIRFHFGSDGGKNNTGWFIDDMSIFGTSIYKVDLICDLNESIVERGKSIKYEIIVKNDGDVEDTIDIEVSNPSGDWRVELEGEFLKDDSVTLASKESTQINLTVIVPYYGIAYDSEIIKVSGTSTGNPDVNDTVDTNTTIDVKYDISMESININKKVKLGEDVEYIFEIINNGSIEDTINLENSIPSTEWKAEIKKDDLIITSVNIEPYKSEEVSLVISAPDKADAYDIEEILFTAKSMGNTKLEFSLLTNTTVEESYGIELSSEDDKIMVQPGDAAIFRLVVKNNGNIFDSYEIEQSILPNDWTIEANGENLNNIEIELDAFESKIILISVFSYEKALPGEIDIDILVTSNGDSSKTDSISLTTIVDQKHYFELVLLNNVVNVDPGKTAFFSIDVINNGNVKETIDFTINSSTVLPAFWIIKYENNKDYYSIDVEKFNKKTIILSVETHENATFNTNAKINIDANGENYSTSQYLNTIINQIYGVELSCKYNSKEADPGESASYTILVKNLGNGEDTIFIKASEPDDGWKNSFEGTGKLSFKLGAKESETITFTVIAPEGNKYGTESSAEISGETFGGIFSNITIITTANFIYDINLNISENSKEIEPKKQISYDIKVTNNGNCVSTIFLEASGIPEGWSAELDSLEEIVEKGDYFEVTLTVNAPKETKKGEKAIISVVVTSGDKSWSTETTTIIKGVSTDDGFNFTMPILLLGVLSFVIVFLYMVFAPKMRDLKDTRTNDYDDYQNTHVEESKTLPEESIEDFLDDSPKKETISSYIKDNEKEIPTSIPSFHFDSKEEKDFAELEFEDLEQEKYVPQKESSLKEKERILEDEKKEIQIKWKTETPSENVIHSKEVKEIPIKEEKDSEKKELIDGFLAQKQADKQKGIEQIQKGKCPVCGRTVFLSASDKQKSKCIWCGTLIK